MASYRQQVKRHVFTKHGISIDCFEHWHKYGPTVFEAEIPNGWEQTALVEAVSLNSLISKVNKIFNERRDATDKRREQIKWLKRFESLTNRDYYGLATPSRYEMRLCGIYDRWLKANKFPPQSADELLYFLRTGER